MSHAGIKRITLNYLTPSSNDFLIVGVIIAKRSPRSFKSKKDGSERGVLGFTLRDSPADYINVTVWGVPMFVENFYSSYRVGDVVDVINLKVIMRKPDDNENSFQPPVTSCMELVFNENHSEIHLHDFDDRLDFIKIYHLPTKPPGNFLNLGDIKSNGKLFKGQFVNILVAVQQVGCRRELKGRNGQDLCVLEIVVLDKTSSGFVVQTWEDDIIQRGLEWKPKDTVLFMSDVRVDWSQYRKAMIATISSRSIVTENPTTREATILSSFAHVIPTETTALVDSLANTVVHPESIVNVMSCSGVISQTWSRESSESFTALVYAVINMFDVDGTVNVVTKQCSRCGLATESSICPRAECTGGVPAHAYNVRMTLIDHTGRLTNCRLTSTAANAVMSLKAEHFVELNLEEKTKLKWNWLMKRVSAKLYILPVGPGTLSPLISIVELRPVSLVEYSSKVPVA